jgi:hypothetical protein
MNPAPWLRPGQQDALAAQRGSKPGEQMSLDGRPRIIKVEDPGGGGVRLRVQRAKQRPVDAVPSH